MVDQRSDVLLRFGDTVSLFDLEHNGFVSAGGFVDQRLWVDRLKDGVSVPYNSRDCRVQIVTAFQYSAWHNLNKYLERSSKDISPDTIASIMTLKSQELDDPQLTSLVRALEEENENNAKEQARLLGKPVTYGMSLQLLHTASGKYITCLNTIADYNHKALKIVLDEHGDEGSWWSFFPGYRTVSEGSRIRHGDIIRILSVSQQAQYFSTTEVKAGVGPVLSRKTSDVVVCTYEVNAFGRAIKIKMVPAGKYTTEKAASAGSRKEVTGGSIVSFLHKDTGSYVSVHNSTLACCRSFSRPVSETKQLGSNSIWSIELTNMEWCVDPCTWSSPHYRFQHLPSGKYLAAVPYENCEDGAEICLVNNNMTENAIWSFEPFTERGKSNVVEDGLNVFLKHSLYGWLHEGNRIENRGDTVTTFNKLHKLYCTEVFNERDAIQVDFVPEILWRDTTRVVRGLNIISSLTQDINNNIEPPNWDDDSHLASCATQVREKVIAHVDAEKQITGTILSLTEGSFDQNPFTRSGRVVKRIQKILREQNAHDVIMCMMKSFFERGFSIEAGSLTDICHPQCSMVLLLCQLGYRLLRLFSTKYEKNSIVLAKYMADIQNHAGSPLMASLTLMELCKDNRRLVTDYISDDVIHRFIALLKRPKSLTARLVKFLTVLLTVKGDPMPMNQDKVTTFFLREEDLLLESKLEGAVNVASEHNVLSIRQKGGSWIGVKEYTERAESIFSLSEIRLKPAESLIRYHVATIDLLAALLLGRNRNSFYAIVNLRNIAIRYKEVLAIAFHPNLPFVLRSSYLELLLRLYVDRDPHVFTKAIQFIFVSPSPVREGKENNPFNDVHVSKQPDSFSPFSQKDLSHLAPTPHFTDLKVFCMDFLKRVSTLSPTYESMNKYVLSVMNMLEFLLHHGFFTDPISTNENSSNKYDSIKELMSCVVSLLDANSRRRVTQSGAVAANISDETVAQILLKGCEMIRYAMNVRVNARISMFNIEYDSTFERPGRMEGIDGEGFLRSSTRKLTDSLTRSRSKLEEAYSKVRKSQNMIPRASQETVDSFNGGNDEIELGDIENIKGYFTADQMKRLSRQMFDESVSTIASGGHDLARIFLELTFHSDRSVNEISIELLFREMQQRAAYVRYALQSFPILSTLASKIVQLAEYDLGEITRLKKWIPEVSRKTFMAKENMDPYDLMTRRLKRLLGMMDEQTFSNPQMACECRHSLRLLGLVDTVVTILRLPLQTYIEDGKKLPVLSERRDLFQRCYDLLKMFAKGTPQNQDVLFPLVTEFADHMGVHNLNVADTISEILRDNMVLIRAMPDKLVQKFADLIKTYGRMPRWIRFYEMLLFVNGEVVASAQNTVLKILLDNDLLDLSGDSMFGSKIILLSSGDHKKRVGSVLQYHRTCLEILAKCCLSNNVANQSKTRALVPYARIMELLLDQLGPNDIATWNDMCFLRAPVVRIFDAAYCRSTHATVLREIGDQATNRFFFSKEKNGCIAEMVAKDVEVLAREFIRQPLYEEVSYQIDYIFNGVLPCMNSYYTTHFHEGLLTDHPEKEKIKKGTDKIFNAIATLFRIPGVPSFIKSPALENMETFASDQRARLTEASVLGKKAFETLKGVDIKKVFKSIHRKGNKTRPLVDLEYRRVHREALGQYAKFIGIMDLDRLMGPGLHSMSVFFGKPENSEYIRNIIHLVRNNPNCDNDMICTVMRMVRGIIHLKCAGSQNGYYDRAWKQFIEGHQVTSTSDKDLKEAQLTYDDYGATDLAAYFVFHSEEAVSLAALRLLNVMVQGSNTKVLKTLSVVTSSYTSTFWKGIHANLRLCSRECKKILDSQRMDTVEGSSSEDEEFNEASNTKKRGHPALVLQVLATITGSRDETIQNNMIGREDQDERFDIIAELVNYGLVLQSAIKEASGRTETQSHFVSLATMVINTLASAIRGPNFELQDHCLSTRLLDLVNRLMQGALESVAAPQMVSMKIATLDLIMLLIEGRSKRHISAVVQLLDWNLLVLSAKSLWEECHDDIDDFRWTPGVDEEDKDIHRELNLYYFVMRRVIPFEVREAADSREVLCNLTAQMDCRRPARIGAKCIRHAVEEFDFLKKHFEEYGGNVEIMRFGRPEPMFFHMMDIKTAFSDTWRSSVIQRIDDNYDDSAFLRMKYFLSLLNDLLYEIHHQKRLSSNIFTRSYQWLSMFTRDAPFFIAVFINVWVILTAGQATWGTIDSVEEYVNSSWNPDLSYAMSQHNIWAMPVARFFMLLHFLLSINYVVWYFFETAPSSVFRRMNAHGRIRMKQQRAKPSSSGWEFTYPTPRIKKMSRINLNWIFLVVPFLPGEELNPMGWDWKPLYVILYPVFSFLGNTVTPYFFWYHLLASAQDRVGKMNLEAISRSRAKLFKMLILASIVLYLFAIIATSFHEGSISECENLFSCMIYFYYLVCSASGMPLPVNFTVPSDFFASSSWNDILFVWFSSWFGVVLVIVFGSIISGIVIDAFGELRDEAQHIQDHKLSHCYVCGMSKVIIDDKGEGFANHVETTHNFWHYLYFIAYLQNKPESQWTGYEVYTVEKFLEQDTSIMPLGKTAAVVEDVPIEDAVEYLSDRLNDTNKKLADVTEMVHQLLERQIQEDDEREKLQSNHKSPMKRLSSMTRM